MFTSQISGVVSVEELCEAIKGLLKSFFPQSLSVYGEVSNLRVMPNFNAFFVLKDANGKQINVTMFSDKFLAQKTKPEDGKSFVISGNLSLYDKRGEIRFIANSCEKIGVGHWQEKFEKLKQMFLMEGLFDLSRKKPLPILPKKIAVITSKDAAALQDFTKTLKNKDWRGKIKVFHATVQGADAVQSIISAMRKAEADTSVDIIVLTRGGGSIEDLWCFNEERLVRAISRLTKPIITAIGHEIDYTLCDFVSDKRAETPTAAAAIIADQLIFFQNKQNTLNNALNSLTKNRLSNLFDKFTFLQKTIKITHPKNKIEQLNKNIDFLFSRILSDYKKNCSIYYQQIEAYSSTFQKTTKTLQAKETDSISKNLKLLATNSIKKFETTLNALHNKLHILSAECNLKRGFLIPINANNKIIDNIETVNSGEKIILLHKYGKTNAVINC